jgi:hypothetical protein
MEMAKPNPGWLRRQAAARKYQPKRIRLLLLAEAPPDEERFFYFEAEDTADPLFTQVGEVLFETPPVGEKTAFLKELRRRGVFVADLKPDGPRRGEPLEPYVAPLLINLTTMSPEAVVLVGSDAYRAAHDRLAKAGVPVVDMKVPAPVAGEEKDFRQKLRQAIVRASLEKLIRPLPKPRG